MIGAKKILVVDDDPAIVRLLVVNLQHAGYQEAHAFSGLEALQRIAEDLPDLVILDIGMPHMTGLEMLRTLREHDATRLLPVIILTANSTDQDLFAGYHGGANFYLTKPFNPAQLLCYIKQLFADLEETEKPDDVFEL